MLRPGANTVCAMRAEHAPPLQILPLLGPLMRQYCGVAMPLPTTISAAQIARYLDIVPTNLLLSINNPDNMTARKGIVNYRNVLSSVPLMTRGVTSIE